MGPSKLPLANCRTMGSSAAAGPGKHGQQWAGRHSRKREGWPAGSAGSRQAHTELEGRPLDPTCKHSRRKPRWANRSKQWAAGGRAGAKEAGDPGMPRDTPATHAARLCSLRSSPRHHAPPVVSNSSTLPSHTTRPWCRKMMRSTAGRQHERQARGLGQGSRSGAQKGRAVMPQPGRRGTEQALHLGAKPVAPSGGCTMQDDNPQACIQVRVRNHGSGHAHTAGVAAAPTCAADGGVLVRYHNVRSDAAGARLLGRHRRRRRRRRRRAVAVAAPRSGQRRVEAGAAAVPADVLAAGAGLGRVLRVVVPLAMLLMQLANEILHHSGSNRVQASGRLVIHDDLAGTNGGRAGSRRQRLGREGAAAAGGGAAGEDCRQARHCNRPAGARRGGARRSPAQRYRASRRARWPAPAPRASSCHLTAPRGRAPPRRSDPPCPATRPPAPARAQPARQGLALAQAWRDTAWEERHSKQGHTGEAGQQCDTTAVRPTGRPLRRGKRGGAGPRMGWAARRCVGTRKDGRMCGRDTQRKARRTLILAAGRLVCSCSKNPTFCPTVSESNSAPLCEQAGRMQGAQVGAG